MKTFRTIEQMLINITHIHAIRMLIMHFLGVVPCGCEGILLQGT